VDKRAYISNTRNIQDRTSDVRIVLLGGQWSGKSSAGNTSLGRKEFGTGGAGTVQCVKSQDEVAGRQVTVVSTSRSPEQVQQIVDSVQLCPPGPHVVLLVIPALAPSFTELKQQLELFNESFWRNTIVLFTWGDELRDTGIEQHIERGGKKLQWQVEKCGNRYHVLNNKNRGVCTQVTELLKKIEDMVAENCG
uniref:AIG1-type G domain-containing protein n=1 Tax=Lepisosteus oculatus TaxID=7918 RepID=W5LVN9_LEPOC